jgi:hypothetical protein
MAFVGTNKVPTVIQKIPAISTRSNKKTVFFTTGGTNMGGITNKLTELSLRNAKPGATTKRLADGGGLFLGAKPNDSKYWRMAH